jgi:uncharacterized protein (TIGR00730 family)
MKTICVFCGSSTGQTEFAEIAASLGQIIARAGYTLLYGGGRVGLMGILADSALSAGGKVVGVIPRFIMDYEVAHRGLTELHVVDGMMSRKQMLMDLADAFVTIPGGLGTLDELFEVWTWRHLSLHNKPIGILNTNGYYDNLLKFLQHSVHTGLVKAPIIDEVIVNDNCQVLLDNLFSKAPKPFSLADKL